MLCRIASIFLVSYTIVSCVPGQLISTNKAPMLNITVVPTAFGEDVLENNSCSLPCWNGLIPGQSTMDNVYEILQYNCLLL